MRPVFKVRKAHKSTINVKNPANAGLGSDAPPHREDVLLHSHCRFRHHQAGRRNAFAQVVTPNIYVWVMSVKHEVEQRMVYVSPSSFCRCNLKVHHSMRYVVESQQRNKTLSGDNVSKQEALILTIKRCASSDHHPLNPGLLAKLMEGLEQDGFDHPAAFVISHA